MTFSRRNAARAAIGAVFAAVGINAVRAEPSRIRGDVGMHELPDRFWLAYLGAVRDLYPGTLSQWLRDGKISPNDARYLAELPYREAQVKQLRTRFMTREQLRAMESV